MRLATKARLTCVAERLEEYAVRLEQLDDSRCVFTRIYAQMTEALRDGLLDKAWNDADWVVELAEAFSMRYFAALDAFDAGQDPGPAGRRSRQR